MDYEQVQFIDQTVLHVHHALGNMLITTGMAVNAGALSPENQALFLRQWLSIACASHSRQCRRRLLLYLGSQISHLADNACPNHRAMLMVLGDFCE